jgi:WD40-like Beta Propeller Repeat
VARWVMAVICAAMICGCDTSGCGCGGGGGKWPLPNASIGEIDLRADVLATVETCPDDEPDGVHIWLRGRISFDIMIQDLVVPAGFTVTFLLRRPSGRIVDLDDEPRRDGNLASQTKRGSSRLSVVIVPDGPGSVAFTLLVGRTFMDAQHQINYKTRRWPIVIDVNCDDGQGDDDDGDDDDSDWDFDIPEEAQEEGTVCGVADKELGACVVIGTEEDKAQPLRRALEKSVTPFLRGVAPHEVGMFVRTADRTEALLVTNYWPLVADDADPPEGTSQYAPRRDLFRIDMVTGDAWRLTRHREDGCSVASAQWSPSGDRIAYILVDLTDPIITTELRVLDVASGVSLLLTDRVMGAVTWSPDGETLAFGVRDELWAIGADGANERRLFVAGDVLAGATEFLEIDWHPTANRIVAVVRGTGGIHGGQIFDLDLDTTQATQLTDGFNDGLLPAESSYDRFPVWSPSGTRVAFIRTTDGGAYHQMLILDVGSGNPPDPVVGTHDYRNLDW